MCVNIFKIHISQEKYIISAGLWSSINHGHLLELNIVCFCYVPLYKCEPTKIQLLHISYRFSYFIATYSTVCIRNLRVGLKTKPVNSPMKKSTSLKFSIIYLICFLAFFLNSLTPSGDVCFMFSTILKSEEMRYN